MFQNPFVFAIEKVFEKYFVFLLGKIQGYR